MYDPLRLQAFLRAVAIGERAVFDIPPFTAYVDTTDPLRFLNYAIPADGAEPDAGQIEQLRAAFRERDRLPRLEWIDECAPAVAGALASAGMAEELRSPLMALVAEDVVAAGADVPDLTIARIGDADLREANDVQRVAFGDAPLAADDQPSDPRPRGGGAVVARAGAELVAVAGWSKIVDGVAEVWGVATAEPWRGRGLAGALTAAASRAIFDAGASLCVLSPGNDTAQRVYARAGYRRVATMLHFSDPE